MSAVSSGSSSSVIAQRLHWYSRPSSATDAGQSALPAVVLPRQVEVDRERLEEDGAVVVSAGMCPFGLTRRNSGCRVAVGEAQP